MQLFLLAVSTLVSEDLACIAAGVLIAQGKLGLIPGVVACFAGIFLGDVLLYLSGRLAGRWVLRWIPADKMASASAWLRDKGASVVFLSRFTPGMRLPVYVAAGLLRTDARRYGLLFAAACAIWTPLLIGATVLFGDRLLLSLFTGATHSAAAFATVFGAAWLLWHGARHPRLRWEFWPAWVVYVPVIPYVLFLAVRYRSLTLFTAANPGIPTGGFRGESKSDILVHLGDAVPEFAVLRAKWPIWRKLLACRRFWRDFPVVAKPDRGERGRGVAVVRSPEELRRYLERANGDVIVQRYAAGLEFGIFYAAGRVLSVTEKRFPVVTGDGRRTLRELIRADQRASCLAAVYERASRRPVTAVVEAGETVQLVEIGSHCRGAIFLDARRHITPHLETAVDRLARRHPGFYFGRFDVRVESVTALREGRDLRVLELNGVTGEPAHIYDPQVGLWEAYQTLFRHWRLAYAIGAENRSRGAQPTPLRELIAAAGFRLRRNHHQTE